MRHVWSEERKHWLKGWQPQLRRDLNRLTDQISRFKVALPQFAAQAEQVARPILQSGLQLLRLSWNNKFNPLSPEEAELAFKEFKENFLAWAHFTTRPDVSQAIADVNTAVQDARIEQREAAAQAERQFLQETNTEHFERRLEGISTNFTQHLRDTASLAMGINQYGKAEDLPIIQRLCLVNFVRFCYDCDPRVSEALKRWLESNPAAEPNELLKSALRSVIIETTLGYVRRPRGFVRGLNDPMSRVESYLGQVFTSVSMGMKVWKAEGLTPRNIGKGYFTVQGVDFSLDAKPSSHNNGLPP